MRTARPGLPASLEIHVEQTTSTFRIAKPFAAALKSVRSALSSSGVSISGELDLSGRLQRSLNLNLPPCVILFGTLPFLMARDLADDPCIAAVTPLHIVVSARGSQTEVHLLRALPDSERCAGSSARAGLSRLQAAVSRTIERIGVRDLNV